MYWRRAALLSGEDIRRVPAAGQTQPCDAWPDRVVLQYSRSAAWPTRTRAAAADDVRAAAGGSRAGVLPATSRGRKAGHDAAWPEPAGRRVAGRRESVRRGRRGRGRTVPLCPNPARGHAIPAQAGACRAAPARLTAGDGRLNVQCRSTACVVPGVVGACRVPSSFGSTGRMSGPTPQSPASKSSVKTTAAVGWIHCA